MNLKHFHETAKVALNHLVEKLDQLEEHYDNLDYDYNNNILNINIGEDCKFVINIHEASQQIWLASPFTGGHHFMFIEEKDQWLSSKNSELFSLLITEVKNALNANF